MCRMDLPDVVEDAPFAKGFGEVEFFGGDGDELKVLNLYFVFAVFLVVFGAVLTALAGANKALVVWCIFSAYGVGSVSVFIWDMCVNRD